MKKIIILFAVYLIGVYMGTLLIEPKTVYVEIEKIVEKTVEIPKEIIKTEYKTEYITVEDKPLFLQIAEEVANAHEYKPDVYDCTQFSYDLVKKLNEAGYEARRIKGYYLGNDDVQPHEWTKLTIYIESTTGQIIEPMEEYVKDYKED